MSIYGSDLSPAVAEKITPSSTNSPNTSSSTVRPASRSTNAAASKLTPTYYASQLDKLGLRLHPGSEHRKDSRETPTDSTRCKSIVYKTLLALPVSHRNKLKDLTLYYTNDGRRGLGGNGSIILRCLNETDTEISSVLTHEMGHLVDARYLTGTPDSPWSGFNDFDQPVSEDDPSSEFYRISWVSETSKVFDSDTFDFVSLYAATDPFEDFAETYAYFRWHGPEFRQLIQTNERLREKYSFMMNYVFEGQEFGKKDFVPQIDVTERNYDVTVLPIL